MTKFKTQTGKRISSDISYLDFEIWISLMEGRRVNAARKMKMTKNVWETTRQPFHAMVY